MDDSLVAVPTLTFVLTRAESVVVLALIYAALKVQPNLAGTRELIDAAEIMESIIYPPPNTARC